MKKSLQHVINIVLLSLFFSIGIIGLAEEETSNSGLSATDQSTTEISTSESQEELVPPVSTDNQLKQTKTFTPFIYGSITVTQGDYYTVQQDVEKQANGLPISVLSNQLITIDSEWQLDNLDSYYHFTTPDNMSGFILHSAVQTSLVYKDTYLTLANQDSDIKVFKDGSLTTTVDKNILHNHTFKTQATIKVNNHSYTPLLNGKDDLIGLAEDISTGITDQPQGRYVSFKKYVSVTSGNDSIYSNFTGGVKDTTKKWMNQTLYAKGTYYHINGTQYLSIYDNKDKWIGYVPSSSVTIATGKSGAYIPYNQYITFTRSSYPIYSNFNWKQINHSKNEMNQTYLAKGRYQHFNGESYLSLYTNKGQWVGYVNAKATTLADGAQGIYQPYNKYVTLKQSSYPIWTNFNWSNQRNSATYQGRTLKAKGRYHHINGSTYLSLYDNKDKWVGYMNQQGASVANGPEGRFQKTTLYLSMANKNQPIWQNFNWTKKDNALNHQRETLVAKGMYQHFNGQTYYSLYNNKNQWIGYINKQGTLLADGKQGIYYSYGKDVTFSSNSYPVWRDFNWSKQRSLDVKGKKFKAKGMYYHFNGSNYYSIYDNKNNWLGYINAKAATQYDMSKLIPNQDSLLAVHHVVQQKILDTSNNRNSIINNVLNMPVISRNDITFDGNHFIVRLTQKNLGMSQVTLTYQDLVGAVDDRLFPQEEVRKAVKPLNKNKKYVALTFDDGPSPVTTPQLLRTLKNKNVKATFFMLGNSVRANPGVARQVKNDGHEIGSHSYSHPQLTSLSSQQVTQQMKDADREIVKATGVLPKSFRPPYGAVNWTVSNAARKPSIMWSIDTRDWESRNPVAINQVVNQNIHNGAIILLHDIHQPSINSVPQMIDNLRRQGYEFVTVDELLQMQQKPNNQYYSRYNQSRF